MKNIITVLSVLVFLISVFICVILGIMTIINAFFYPELTTTQNILYFLFKLNGIYFIITLLTSYIIMGIVTKD